MSATKNTQSGSTATLPDLEVTAQADDEQNEIAVADEDTEGTSDVESRSNTEPKGWRRLRRRRWTAMRQAVIAGVAMAVACASLAGWWGYRAYETHQIAAQKAQFVQVARQGAVNLTTVDWEHADRDVQRILDSASGEFYDDFAKRSQPFVDVVKQTKSKSVGNVAEAGLESSTGDQAQVLVAVNVKTSLAGAPEQAPRSWRMRISVHKQGNEMKVSNVEFVP